MKKILIDDFKIGEGEPLAIIAGPCVIENEEHTLSIAASLQKMMRHHPFSMIFKASYDKANRSSYSSFRGPGIEEGLSVLREVKERFGIPVVSDIHLPEEVQAASEVLDILQIPAFLCRQTDLVVDAAKSGSRVI